MHASLRQCTAWLHTWTGLVVGWVLFFVFVTGTTGYFQYEITGWMQPERPMAEAQSNDLPALQRMADLALHRLQKVAPEAVIWHINLPHLGAGERSWQQFNIRWDQAPAPGKAYGASTTQILDPSTGAVLDPEVQPRATGGGVRLYRMHYELRYIPYEWAIRIVGVCTMLMLLAIVTGVITHKKIFKDFFVFRPRKGQRSWLDAHNAISVGALPFFLMITYSGLVFFMYTYMPAGRDMLYGNGHDDHLKFNAELHGRGDAMPASPPKTALSPLLAQAVAAWGRGKLASVTIEHLQPTPPQIILSQAIGSTLDRWHPPTLRFDAETGEALPVPPRMGGSAVVSADVMLDLHEGLFAGIWGRWLYFISGLLGCAMIATGLVLWTVKRRKYHLGSGCEMAETFGVRLVENLNVATIAGLPLALAAYFWANRLLPVSMADRAAWEFHSLFAVWLGALFYALARPVARAWIELLAGCCLAFAAVPAINALTTDRHLGHSLPTGDWVFAGFDLSMLGFAALFGVMAMKVQRRIAPLPKVQDDAISSTKAGV